MQRTAVIHLLLLVFALPCGCTMLSDTKTRSAEAVHAHLRRTVVPEMIFDKTPLVEALRFLEAATGATPEGRRVRFLLHLGSSDRHADTTQPTTEFEATVTWSAWNVSVHDALAVMADLCGLKWYVQDCTVVITWRDEDA